MREQIRFRYLKVRQMLGVLALTLVTSVSLASDKSQSSSWPFLHTSDSPHSVRVINDGVDALETRLEMIERAKTSIDFMVYIFQTDESSKLVLHRLMQKALEGVHVRLLLDYYTVGGKTGLTEEILSAVQGELSRQAGPQGLKGSFEVRYYNRGTIIGSLGRVNFRNHAKLLVVDKDEVLVGGRNVADDYFALLEEGFEYIDREIWVKALPAANTHQSVGLQGHEAFNAYWMSERWVSQPLKLKQSAGDIALKIASLDDVDSPLSKEFRLRETVRTAIAHLPRAPKTVLKVTLAIDRPGHDTKDRIVTPVVNALLGRTNQYLFIENWALPMSDQRTRLIETVAAKKVPVLILTNSYESADSAGASAYSQVTEARLLKSANTVWVYALVGHHLPNETVIGDRLPPKIASTHAKTIVSVSDNRWVTSIGSYNFDVRSERTNNECIVIVDDEEIARGVATDIGYRMAYSHPLAVNAAGVLYYTDSAEYERRSFSTFKKTLEAVGLGQVWRNLY